MAKVTLFFAILLIALGLVVYLGTGSIYPTALIPTWIGLLLGIFGWLAMSPDESRRKLFMHINVTIGLVCFLGAFVWTIHSMFVSRPLDLTAIIAKLALAWLLFIYVILCAYSFVNARRSGKV